MEVLPPGPRQMWREESRGLSALQGWAKEFSPPSRQQHSTLPYGGWGLCWSPCASPLTPFSSGAKEEIQEFPVEFERPQKKLFALLYFLTVGCEVQGARGIATSCITCVLRGAEELLLYVSLRKTAVSYNSRAPPSSLPPTPAWEMLKK